MMLDAYEYTYIQPSLNLIITLQGRLPLYSILYIIFNTISNMQLRKLRFKEFKKFGQSHMVSKQQNQDLNRFANLYYIIILEKLTGFLKVVPNRK